MVLLLALFSLEASAGTNIFVLKNQLEITTSVVSTEAISSDIRRNYLFIQNKGLTTVYISVGSASVGTDGLAVVAGGAYEYPIAPKASVYLKAAAGAPIVYLAEGIEP